MIYEEPGWDWMLPIFLDRSLQKVFMAAVQCGKTDFCMIWTFCRLDKGLSGAYVLPTKVIRDRFIDERVNPIIERVPYYRAAVKGMDNKAIKKFQHSTIHFLGSNVSADFFGFTIQFYIIDELDKCTTQYLGLLNDRVSSTKRLTGKDPEWIKISNPSVAGYGIHNEYNKSDKKVWKIKCEHCNEWQSLDWFKHVVRQEDEHKFALLDGLWCTDADRDIDPLCRHCNKPLNRLQYGEWVAEFPDKEISGYHISKLFTNQTTIRKMFCEDSDLNFVDALHNQTQLQQFYNSNLGLPYEGAGDKLQWQDFERCQADYLMPQRCTGTVGGVDVGNVLHVRIDRLVRGKRQAVFIGIVPDWNELDALFKRMGTVLFVIDSMPEIHKAREFVKAHSGGYLCEYSKNERTGGAIINRQDKIIRANRTESLDESTAAYMDALIELPRNWKDLDNKQFVEQMMAPTRILDVERKPPQYVWSEDGQPDHHRHADNYCHMAAKLRGFGGSREVAFWV